MVKIDFSLNADMQSKRKSVRFDLCDHHGVSSHRADRWDDQPCRLRRVSGMHLRRFFSLHLLLRVRPLCRNLSGQLAPLQRNNS
jgi:hypothetical protein